MVAKLFTKPFGVAGDKTPIPNGTQVDGTVSYETGFGADYERQLGVDPAAKNIGRQTFNELMFDATTSLQEMQAGFGTSVYSLTLAQALPGGGYPKGALIPRLAGDGFWLCTTAANTSNPDTGGAGWVQLATQGSFYAIDTGIANAYSCVFSPALAVRSEAQALTVRVKTTNTGASTVNDGLGTVPLVGLAQAALQGGELTANGVAVLQWVAAIASYVVVYTTGGAMQVANATKSRHAVNVGQLQAQSVTAFSTTGTATAQVLTPVPAITAYTAFQRFNVAFNIASGLNPTINISGLGVKNIKQYDATGAKVAAVFFAGQLADVEYDGTDFILLNNIVSINKTTSPFDATPGLVTVTGDGGWNSSGTPAAALVSDADAWTVSGSARTGPAWTGSPYAGSQGRNQGTLLHQCGFSDATYASQLFLGIAADNIWFRRKTANVWQPPVEVYTTASFGAATTAASGIVELATSAETIAGTDAVRAVTPAGLAAASPRKAQCTAWVNFNGNGSIAIRDSYNCLSITDNGVGDYTFNWLNQTNAFYSYSNGTSVSGGVSGGSLRINESAVIYSATQLRLVNGSGSTGISDCVHGSVQIFGGQ